jgi:transposase InsO family protein
MGQVLHWSATTTEAVGRAIQHSQESLRTLAKRHGINQKTVAKWRRRTTAADLPTGPREPKSTVLSIEDEAIIVAFRRHTLLALDDCLYALQATIPHLTRSSLHRCLQRNHISRLPDVTGDKPGKRKFKAYPIGYVHIDIAEIQTAEGKLYIYVAIDRTSKFAVVQLVTRTGRTSASAFLVHVIKTIPYKIHTVLTDNGIQFTFPPRYADGPTARYMTHMFDMRCRENCIEHRLTKIKHPWTNGQVERMNRTIKEATVKRYHYASHQQLETHLTDFINAYNYGKRLKTLRGLTPYEFICKTWTNEPERFTLNPLHQMPGLNIQYLVSTFPRQLYRAISESDSDHFLTFSALN